MSISIQVSSATGKALHTRWHQASLKDDGRLVRRMTVVIDLLVHHVPVEVLHARWGLSISCLSQWRQDVLRRGMDSVVYHQSGGRRPTLTPRQKKRLVELREAGPQAVGCATAWWTSVRIRVLIWRECGVLYNGQDVWTVLHTWGFAFPKARVVSDPRDAARRQAWLQEEWPMILRAAKRRKGLRLFEAEASLAQGGSCRDTWARRGQHPAVKTSGQRQGDKVFGAMAYCSGRLCSQGLEGRFASDSDPAC